MQSHNTILRWDEPNRRYTVECQDEYCTLFQTFEYGGRNYQLGEARRKAYAAFSKHVDSHIFPGARAGRAEREAIVKNMKRTGGMIRIRKGKTSDEPPPF